MSSGTVFENMGGNLEQIGGLLASSLDTLTDDGVHILPEMSGFVVGRIVYIDHSSGREIRSMSTDAYAAEFLKVAGIDLNQKEYDDMTEQCQYLGALMAFEYSRGRK